MRDQMPATITDFLPTACLVVIPHMIEDKVMPAQWENLPPHLLLETNFLQLFGDYLEKSEILDEIREAMHDYKLIAYRKEAKEFVTHLCQQIAAT